MAWGASGVAMISRMKKHSFVCCNELLPVTKTIAAGGLHTVSFCTRATS